MSKTNKAMQERGVSLMDCIQKRDKAGATKLLQEGADLAVVKSGDCPIHYAARNGDKDMLELLLSFNDNVNRQNQNKNTPMHLATREGHFVAVQFLKGKNANLNAKNEDGETPLHSAVIMQSMDYIEKIINLGMKVNEVNKQGQTPLHISAMHSRQEAMEALLFKKANPAVVDKQGKTAADVAKSPKIEKQLRTYSALIAAKEAGYITAQGAGVNPKKTMEMKLDRVGVHITAIESKQLLPFQLYCRREKTENSEVLFETEEAEEAVSDIFRLRISDCIEVVSLELVVPLYSEIKPNEQAILKVMEKDAIDFDDLKEIDGRTFGHLKLDLHPETDEVFVLYTKPRTEIIAVGGSSSIVKSKMDKSFQLEVPENSFSTDTQLTLKVYENVAILPPRKKRKVEEKPTKGNKTDRGTDTNQDRGNKTKQEQTKKDNKSDADRSTETEGTSKVAEIKPALLSDLYEINVEGNQPAKDITVTCPVLKQRNAVPKSEIVIITADENNMKDETSLQIVQSEPNLVNGKFVFSVSHFSTYVPVLRSLFEENPREVFRQILGAKKRQQQAVFFVMVLEKIDGDTGSIVVVEVIETRKANARIDFWIKKGYKAQLGGETDNILTEPNQEFTIEIAGNAVADGAATQRKITFMPRRASYQPFRVRLDDPEADPIAEIKLIPTLNAIQDTSSLEVFPEEIILPFLLPPPPKPFENLTPSKFDPAKTDLKGPLTEHLKTLFYKHPFMDATHEKELQAKLDAMLKEFGVQQPPPVMIKNSIAFCKRTFDDWRERVFYALIHNDGEVNTATLSPHELCTHVLAEYLPSLREVAHVDFVLLLRCNAHELDAFIRSTNGKQRQSDKELPVTNSTFWRNFQVMIKQTDVKNPKVLEKVIKVEKMRIEKCQNNM